MDIFIILAVIVIFFLLSDVGRKNTKPAKYPFPPIKKPLPPPEKTAKRSLDYMMHKPQKNTAAETAVGHPPLKREPSLPELKSTPVNIAFPKAPSTSSQQNSSPIFTAGNIPRPVTTSQYNIDISKTTLTKAIIYAEILKAPKSLEYMQRYGIRRFPKK